MCKSKNYNYCESIYNIYGTPTIILLGISTEAK